MRALAFACLALAATMGHAAHPLITEDTGTQGAARWQLEGTSEYERDRATRRREELNTFVLSLGLARQADWQVSLPWYGSGEGRTGDLSLDLKWRFFEREAFSLGFKPGVTLPTGDELVGRGAGRATWGALFIVSYEPGPLALHAHAGYRNNRNRLGDRDLLTHFSAAVTYQVGDVKLVADLARDTSPDPAQGRAERYLVLGAIWSVRRDFDLDAGWKKAGGSSPLEDALLFGATLRW